MTMLARWWSDIEMEVVAKSTPPVGIHVDAPPSYSPAQRQKMQDIQSRPFKHLETKNICLLPDVKPFISNLFI